MLSVAGGFKQLAILASSAILLVYLAVILATLKLRTIRKEDSGKTFKATGGFIIPFIGIAAIVWLLTNLSNKEILSTIIFIGVIAVIYFVMRQYKIKK
jgi:basic amino acid/polyamine antiporter, APA family